MSTEPKTPLIFERFLDPERPSPPDIDGFVGPMEPKYDLSSQNATLEQTEG